MNTNERSTVVAQGSLGVKKRFDTKTLAVLAMITAIAYVLASVIRIPLVPAVGFLGYEPKDVVLVIAGFIYGPVAPLAMITIIALLEGVTSSVLGPAGIPMNFIASASFCVTASFIYSKKRTVTGAVLGLALGTIATTASMLLWNYILTPILMGWPRELVVEMLIPGFLPFNIIKGVLNSAFAMLLYKPIRRALDSARLVPATVVAETGKSSVVSKGVLIASAFIVVSVALMVLIRFDVI